MSPPIINTPKGCAESMLPKVRPKPRSQKKPTA
ncbi:hypothetical protein L917_07117 [Phytophthora nicotianae]|nr:hypothetical protein L917_07117 [Phytophthora nicotianae]